jgi:predicted GNAT family acetyltransferase
MTSISESAARLGKALAGPGPTHPLDQPIWAALTSRHGAFAHGDGLARRYPADMAPFAAVRDPDPAGFVGLAQIAAPGDTLALLSVHALTLPEAFTVERTLVLDQMMACAAPMDDPVATRLEPLGTADVPEMMDLVALTKPGPFQARTIEMGAYFGIRIGQRLVAMAGERIALEGYTEISAVCTHPDHRGQGHARVLVAALARMIHARGEVPFLHVIGGNTPAIGLYRQLGFVLRRTLQLTVVRRDR